jgi:transcriptional regulator with XRE-family HTH domain
MARQSKRRTDAYDIAIGRRVRAHRLACNWSQTRLGAELGITYQQLQKYETGTNRIGAGRLQRIAEVFGVPIKALFEAETAVASRQTETLAFLNSAGATRLLRAYAAIRKPRMRHVLIVMAEEIAGGR